MSGVGSETAPTSSSFFALAGLGSLSIMDAFRDSWKYDGAPKALERDIDDQV